MADFVSGLALARRYYAEVVRPIISRTLPAGVSHSAALIGPGSEVLGFDTDRSRDHDWGPRCQIFLVGKDFETIGAALTAVLAAELPSSFLGYPIRFALSHGDGRPTPQVQVHDAAAWWRSWSGVEPGAEPTIRQWLSLPCQRLAELTGGEVFHDGTGTLGAARTRLACYPDDVWAYVLASTWQRISEEHAFVGRCAEVGDELGSAVVAARLARDVMRLWVLMDRQYPPYSKWLGTAFAATPGTAPVGAALISALAATALPARARGLVTALSATVERHNARCVRPGAALVDPSPRTYFDRPYQVVDVDAVVAGLRARISDPTLAAARPVGAIDAFVDNVGVTGNIDGAAALVDAVLADRR